MTSNIERPQAQNPEDIPRLFIEFVKAGDFDGLATLYEDSSVLALPTGEIATGSQAIAGVFAERFAGQQSFDASGPQLQPVLRCGDLALTSTRMPDGRTTVEVARQQADGSWRWVIDQPKI